MLQYNIRYFFFFFKPDRFSIWRYIFQQKKGQGRARILWHILHIKHKEHVKLWGSNTIDSGPRYIYILRSCHMEKWCTLYSLVILHVTTSLIFSLLIKYSLTCQIILKIKSSLQSKSIEFCFWTVFFIKTVRDTYSVLRCMKRWNQLNITSKYMSHKINLEIS